MKRETWRRNLKPSVTRGDGKWVESENLKEVSVLQKEKRSNSPEAAPWKTRTPAPSLDLG